MYFSTSLTRFILLPHLLHRVDWSSRVHSFDCDNASLAILHTSKSLRDPSNSSLYHFSCCSWAKACVQGNRSNLSTQSCKSWMPISFWLNDVDDEEVASEHLNLLKWSLNSEMRGFALVGKLLERKWWREFWFTEEEAMFKQERCLTVACTILCSNFLCLVSICSIYMMGRVGIGISIFSNINEL